MQLTFTHLGFKGTFETSKFIEYTAQGPDITALIVCKYVKDKVDLINTNVNNEHN